MGEVYRARDTRLGRDVALKTLPAALTADRDRLQRFDREARLLAALNHPNIAVIYGVETMDAGLEATHPQHALVLELVEGPTLAERIARGPMSIPDALAMARQIAAALDAAHEKGIVHRDLKPANIKLTSAGVVKVLDFGLARATKPERAIDESGAATTAVGMTGDGTVLGTAPYMSPEQARGESVDKRTDIWAFGCVLYEMLSGRQTFAERTIADTLAAIIHRDPDWSILPAATPEEIRRLLARCLEKDPARRQRDIGDVGHALDAPFDATLHDKPASTRRALVVGLAVAAAAAAAIAFAALTWTRSGGGNAESVTRLFIPLSSADSVSWASQPLTISPDGRRIAYAANGRLYVRALDALDPIPVAGTEPSRVQQGGREAGSAGAPFFSPDGEWLAYVQAGEIRKVAIAGGPPVTIAPSPVGLASGWWSEPDSMLFGAFDIDRRTGGVWRLPAAGGAPKLVIPAERGQIVMAPQLVAGGRDILFTSATAGRWDEAEVSVYSMDRGTREVLIRGGLGALYVSSGHLIYGSRGTLYAVRFDPASRRVERSPVPVVRGVAQPSTAGAWRGPLFAVSTNGTLVYLPEAAVTIRRVPVWVDRQGNEEPLPAEPRAYQTPRISPDGRRVAFDMRDQENDVWLWDFAGRRLTRLSFDRLTGGTALWSRDGQFVVFGPNLSGIQNLVRQRADGTGEVERLTSSPNAQMADAFSADGRQIVFEEADPKSKFDLRILTLCDKNGSHALLQTPFNEQNADLSADGRWLAYQSDESGRPEVYVRPFPDVASARWQVSPSGGTRPLWSRDGRELFYLDTERRLTVVSVRSAQGFSTEAPTTLFDTTPFGLQGIGRNFDISPDGRRFLFVKSLPAPPDARRFVVVQRWFDELNQLVP
jgi:serine/threonine-protein kinase